MDRPTWSPEDVRPEEGRPGESAPQMPTAPTTPVMAQPKRRGSSSNAILVVALLVAVGGITFAAGRLTAPASTSGSGPGGNGFAGGQVPGGYGAGIPGGYGMPDGATGPGALGGLGSSSMVIRGTVSAVDSDSITLTLESGSTVEIATDGTTTYHGQTAAASGDVQVGSTVAVEVSGFRGAGRNTPGSSVAPAASPGAADGQANQSSTGTAVDVTITEP